MCALHGSQTNDVFDGERFLTNYGGRHRRRDLERRGRRRARRGAPRDLDRQAADRGDDGGRDDDDRDRRPPRPCICPRVVPVAEAMMAIALVDAWLRQRAVRGRDR